MVAQLEEVINRSFDYIIVGGGTSGLCLAARLSSDPSISVAVLEAGEANIDDKLIMRSASYGAHFGIPAYDWNFTTVPQRHANDNVFSWSRGKGLGGSSAINFMVWTKPPADEINDIEKLGNPGWNWENYERFSSRTERFTHPTDAVQTKHGLKIADWKSGTEGPILTAFPSKIMAAELDIQQTLINSGLPVAPKPLNGDPRGVFFTCNTVDPKTSTRSYATSAFFVPNMHRPNLAVLVNAQANKIVMEQGSSGLAIATGVDFESGGQTYVLKANKEVILCAGGLKSSQILELSGIGNPQLLKSLDIPVVTPLERVGENVQEHIFTGVTWELREDVSFETLDILRDPKVAAEHQELHARGEDAVYNLGMVGFSFVPLTYLSSRAQDIYSAAKASVEERRREGLIDDAAYEIYKIQMERLDRGAPWCETVTFPGFLSFPNPPEPGKKYITMLCLMNHCWSRGSIHAKSKDANVQPDFDPHYFEEDIDKQTFVEAINWVRRLSELSPLKDMIVKEVNPGPEVKTDEDVEYWLKTHMTTTYHTIGSCSMLPKEKGGVVDPKLKVYGTSNVRVADLSVIPIHFASHTQATAYEIAEQAADIITGKI